MRLTDSAHRGQKRLKLLTAIAAAVQVILHQGHRLGSIFAGERHIHKLVHLFKTLGAADLIRAGRSNSPGHLLEQVRIEPRG